MEKHVQLTHTGSLYSEHSPSVELVSPGPILSVASTLAPPNPRQIKQCLRLFRSLTQDIQRQQPQIKTPATWLLKSLLETHYSSAPDYDWRATITATLRNILHTTSPLKRHQYRALVEAHGSPALTSKEHTSIADINIFANALLALLETHNAD